MSQSNTSGISCGKVPFQLERAVNNIEQKPSSTCSIFILPDLPSTKDINYERENMPPVLQNKVITRIDARPVKNVLWKVLITIYSVKRPGHIPEICRLISSDLFWQNCKESVSLCWGRVSRLPSIHKQEAARGRRLQLVVKGFKGEAMLIWGPGESGIFSWRVVRRE